jgi:Mrp family chromosome partitioning ATPase
MLLAELAAHADIVIIDSPPVTSVVDAIVLSQMVDGVVMVLRANKTRRDTALRALETLRQVGAPVIGAILNGVAYRSGVYSHSAYGYPSKTISGAYPSPRYRAYVHRNGKAPVRKQSGLPPGQTVEVGEQ